MTLRQYLGFLRRSILVILIGAVLGALAAVAVTTVLPVRYESQASVYISASGTNSITDAQAGTSLAQSVAEGYATVATSDLVLGQVVSDLSLGTTTAALKNAVSVTVPLGTSVIAVTVDDRSPRTASAVANKIATELIDSVPKLVAPSRGTAASVVRATQINFAQPATDPVFPMTTINIAAGIAVGALLGLLLAAARRALDSKLHTAYDLERAGAGPVIGTILLGGRSKQPDGYSPAKEAMRTLRAGLEYTNTRSSGRVLAVSSSVEGEGKTSLALDLAAVYVGLNKRVLIIDADLRRPRIATRLGLDGSVGLSGVLAGFYDLTSATQTSTLEGLHVLPSGTIPPNPAELLESDAMRDLIEECSTQYEVVLIDTPPVLAAVDAATVGRRTDGILLLARGEMVRRTQVEHAVSALARLGAPLIGSVLLTKAQKNATYYEYQQARGSRGGARGVKTKGRLTERRSIA